LLVGAVVHPADTQDRDGAPLVFAGARHLYPWLRHVFADGAYNGAKLSTAFAKSAGGGSRSSSAPMSPRDLSFCRGAGWSSTFAWRNRNRRLAKDFEATLESALAWLFLASAPHAAPRQNRTAKDGRFYSAGQIRNQFKA
jgi:hypothetical protein